MGKITDIRALQKLLPDRLDAIREIQHDVVMCEWDAHHAVTVIGSDCIGDYQVIRKFDIEIEPNMNWEYDLLDTLTDDEKKYVTDEDGEINDNFYETYDPYDHFYEFEIGEYMQIWYNVKDHTITKFGRIDKKDPYYCELDGKWIDISTHLNKMKRAFLKHFNGTSAVEGYYKDFSVHPDLLAAGYTGIDSFNWEYGCGEEEHQSSECKFIIDREIDKLYTDILLNRTEESTHIRLYGLDNYIFAMHHENRDFALELMAAMRICQRHKYQISDKELWRDMVYQLYLLGKDLHNPFYVCPADLRQAHDKVSAMYRKNEKKIAERKKLEKQKQEAREAMDKLAEFISRMESFFDLCFKNEHLVIQPLRSPLEYIEEGQAMSHCVASYKDRYNSLILSARDLNDQRIATIEVSLQDYRIIQIRGKCNQRTEYNDEIAILLTKNMNKIRKANNKQKKLNAALSA